MYAEELRNSEEAKVELANVTGSEFAILQHHCSSRNLRNEWRMADKESMLSKSAVQTYGLIHPDDISGLIVRGGVAKYRGEDYFGVVANEAMRYKAHWISRGLDPATMERLPK